MLVARGAARRWARPAVAGSVLGFGGLAMASAPTEALPGPKPAANKVVHEVTLSVPKAVEGDFKQWLPTYLANLLERPGLLGAKILTPAAPVEQPPAVLFVLGGPGAGKGTQSEHIVAKYGYTHLSAGDLLRAERNSGSETGAMISEYIKEGKIVPVEVTVQLLLDAIAKDGGKRFLVDGFPRNTNNLAGWQKVAGGALNVAGVLFYDCPEAVMEERLLQRGKTSGRSDDNLESIRKRFHTYVNETKPILAYYDFLGLVHKIDGTRPVEEVWADTQAVIDGVEAACASDDARVVCKLHVHCTASEGASLLPPVDLVVRIQAKCDERWGAGTVRVEGGGFAVTQSLKAFGMDALRSFD